MDFLFTKQRGTLFALTGFLLWLSLSSGLPTAQQNYQVNVESRYSAQSAIANWVRELADQVSLQGQIAQRDVILSPTDGYRKRNGFPAESRLSYGLAPDYGALAFHQLYETHCYQRTATDDPHSLTEL